MMFMTELHGPSRVVPALCIVQATLPSATCGWPRTSRCTSAICLETLASDVPRGIKPGHDQRLDVEILGGGYRNQLCIWQVRQQLHSLVLCL